MDDEALIKEFIRVAGPGDLLENDNPLEMLVFVDLDTVAICVCEIEWPKPTARRLELGG